MFDWWEVPDLADAADVRGGAMRIAADELDLVAKDGRLIIRPCTTEVTGTHATISGCGLLVSATLDGDRLTLESSRGGGFTSTRATPERAVRLTADLGARRPAGDVCERARVCYRDAMAAAGVKGNEAFEFGDRPSPTDCARMIPGLRDLLAQKGMTVPASCR